MTRDLSPKMFEALQFLQTNGDFKRYDGGFWSWRNAEMKPLYNGGRLLCMVPKWHCNVKTLRALQQRGLVHLDEERKKCTIIKEEGENI